MHEVSNENFHNFLSVSADGFGTADIMKLVLPDLPYIIHAMNLH